MARWYDYGWDPPVIATPQELRERLGRAPTPVSSKPYTRKIAQTFWGQAWCNHLEAYRDLSNRLPRGRTYLRNGSVRDLHIERGCVAGLVQGTSLYEVEIDIEPMLEAPAEALIARIGGGLASVVELLDGRLSRSVIDAVVDPNAGLFPGRQEISFGCSCPDGARVCKHVAAVFYGVALRLDQDAELFFRLRGIEPARLVEAAPLSRVDIAPKRRLDGDLGSIFGVLIEDAAPEEIGRSIAPKRQAKKRAASRKPAAKNEVARKKRATKKKVVKKRATKKKVVKKKVVKNKRAAAGGSTAKKRLDTKKKAPTRTKRG